MINLNFFYKKKKKAKVLTKTDIQMAIEQYLTEHSHASIRSLINKDDTVDYTLLSKYLHCIPENYFIMSKETGEIFEDTEENKKLVKWINKIQQVVDQYVYDLHEFPVKENNEQLEICYMKLKPYLKELPPTVLYLSEKYYTITAQPEIIQKNSVDIKID